MVVVVIGIAVFALILGWVVGMLTFRRTLRWCPRDGASLTCPVCDGRPIGANSGIVPVNARWT